MSWLEVIRPGPLSLLQDGGRPGLAGIGVTRSGAADRGAYLAGAALVGNDPAGGDAAIEIVLGGLAFRVLEGPVRIAVTGAPCPLRLGEVTLPYGRVVELGTGDVVSLGMAPVGLRCYLSVAGGIAAAPDFGSRSRDTLAGIGPQPLRPGSRLPVGPPVARSPGSPVSPLPAAGWGRVLSVQEGPRKDWILHPAALGRAWEASASSDRVGVRLIGEPLAWAPSRIGRELPPEPVVRGAVQVPPSGLPVVFGPDHPTTGGYPVLGVLTEAASDQLAQVRPGDVVTLAWQR